MSSSSGWNRGRRAKSIPPAAGRRRRGGGRRKSSTAAVAVAEDGTKDRPIELLFDSDGSDFDDNDKGTVVVLGNNGVSEASESRSKTRSEDGTKKKKGDGTKKRKTAKRQSEEEAKKRRRRDEEEEDAREDAFGHGGDEGESSRGVADRGASDGAVGIAEPSTGAMKASGTTAKTAIPTWWDNFNDGEAIDEQLRAIGTEDGVAWATGDKAAAASGSFLRGDGDGIVGGGTKDGEGVPLTSAATTAFEDAEQQRRSAERSVVRPESVRSLDDVVAELEGPQKRRSPPPSEEMTARTTAVSVVAATTTASLASSRQQGPIPKRQKKKKARPEHRRRWLPSTKSWNGAKNEEDEVEDAKAKAKEANLSDSSDDYASLYWTVKTDVDGEAEGCDSSDDCASLFRTIEANIGEAEERALATTTTTTAVQSPSSLSPLTTAPRIGAATASATAASSSFSSTLPKQWQQSSSNETTCTATDNAGKNTVASRKHKRGVDNDDGESRSSSGGICPTRRDVKMRAGKSTGTWPPQALPRLMAPHRQRIQSDNTTCDNVGDIVGKKNDAVPSPGRYQSLKRVDDGEGGYGVITREGSTNSREEAESKSSSPSDVSPTRRHVKIQAGKSTGTWPPMPRKVAAIGGNGGKDDVNNVVVPSLHGCESLKKVIDEKGSRVVVVACEASTDGGEVAADVSFVLREGRAADTAPRKKRNETHKRLTMRVDYYDPKKDDKTTRDGNDVAVPLSRIRESPKKVGIGGGGHGNVSCEASATGEGGADDVSSSVLHDECAAAALHEGRNETRKMLVTTISGGRALKEEDNDATPSLRRHKNPKVNQKRKGSVVVVKESLVGSGKGADDAPPTMHSEARAESPKKNGDKGGSCGIKVARKGMTRCKEGADNLPSSVPRVGCATATTSRQGRNEKRETPTTTIRDCHGPEEETDDKEISSRDNGAMRSHCNNARSSAVTLSRRRESLHVGEKEAHSIVDVVTSEGLTGGEEAGTNPLVPRKGFDAAATLLKGRDGTRKALATLVSGHRTEKDGRTMSHCYVRDSGTARNTNNNEEEKEETVPESTNREYGWMVPGMHLSVPDGLKRIPYDALVLSTPEKSLSDGVWRVLIKWVIQGGREYVDCADCHTHEDFCTAAEANGDYGGGERHRRSSRRKRSQPDRWGDLKALPDQTPRGKVPYSSPHQDTCKREARTPLSRSPPKHILMSSSATVAVRSREKESDVDSGGHDVKPPVEANKGHDKSKTSVRKEGTVPTAPCRRLEEIECGLAADRDKTDEGGATRLSQQQHTMQLQQQQRKQQMQQWEEQKRHTQQQTPVLLANSARMWKCCGGCPGLNGPKRKLPPIVLAPLPSGVGATARQNGTVPDKTTGVQHKITGVGGEAETELPTETKAPMGGNSNHNNNVNNNPTGVTEIGSAEVPGVEGAAAMAGEEKGTTEVDTETTGVLEFEASDELQDEEMPDLVPR